MTQIERELHERFIKGITIKMLIVAALGLVSAVSSFWIGFSALKDEISDNNTKTNTRMTIGFLELKKNMDSIQHLNELQFLNLWNEVKRNNNGKPIGYYTEKKDKNGTHFQEYKP